jgi:hypothetical protein
MSPAQPAAPGMTVDSLTADAGRSRDGLATPVRGSLRKAPARPLQVQKMMLPQARISKRGKGSRDHVLDALPFRPRLVQSVKEWAGKRLGRHKDQADGKANPDSIAGR